MGIVYGIIGVVFWVIGALLGLRFLLKFFGANESVAFARWIYDAAQAFLTPFFGIFPTITISERFMVEFSTLFAIIVYALVYYIILWILSYIFPPLPPEGGGPSDEEIAERRAERRRRYGPRL